MIATPINEPIPIPVDEHGRFRIGNTPETTTEQYPSLSLEEVYITIGCYLRHRDEIDAYLRQQEAEAFPREYKAQHPNGMGKSRSCRSSMASLVGLLALVARSSLRYDNLLYAAFS